MGLVRSSIISLLVLLTASFRWADAASATFDVTGKLIWPDTEASAGKIKLILSTNGIISMYAWPQPDGKFVFHNVPAGSHTLDVAAINLVYPQMRVDVSAGGGGRVLVTLAGNELQAVQNAYAAGVAKRLLEPLIIRPVAKAEYFEQRAPFSILGFLKTPYGLMIIFGLLAVFVLPHLKVDPEEYEEMVKQVQPGSSSSAVASPAQRKRN